MAAARIGSTGIAGSYHRAVLVLVAGQRSHACAGQIQVFVPSVRSIPPLVSARLPILTGRHRIRLIRLALQAKPDLLVCIHLPFCSTNAACEPCSSSPKIPNRSFSFLLQKVSDWRHAPIARKTLSTRAYEEPGWHCVSRKIFLAPGAPWCIMSPISFAIPNEGAERVPTKALTPPCQLRTECIFRFWLNSAD